MGRRILTVALAAAVGLIAGAGPAAAQSGRAWRLSDIDFEAALGRDPEPIGARTDSDLALGALGQRLDLGLLDLGVKVAPRWPAFTLGGGADGGQGRLTRPRLLDSEISTTDIGVDLRIRWPAFASPTEPSGLARLTPYFSLGPALSVPVGEEPLSLTRATGRGEPAMSFGMQGALGVTWQLAPAASLFGEYRLIQDRALDGRTGGDVGVDLYYGFSLRF